MPTQSAILNNQASFVFFGPKPLNARSRGCLQEKASLTWSARSSPILRQGRCSCSLAVPCRSAALLFAESGMRRSIGNDDPSLALMAAAVCSDCPERSAAADQFGACELADG